MRRLATLLALLPLPLPMGCDRADGGVTDPPAKVTASPTDAASEDDAAPKDDAAPNNEAAPPDPGPPGKNGELRELEGLSEAQLLARLGEPTSKKTFAMADCCHEFEIELYNTYPPGKGHDDVQIHEWTWNYDGYALTVWSHRPDGAEWVVLDTSHYSDGTEF